MSEMEEEKMDWIKHTPQVSSNKGLHVKSGKSLQSWKISYEFDSTIANWQDRLTSAYEMLFAKIEEMEEEQDEKI